MFSTSTETSTARDVSVLPHVVDLLFNHLHLQMKVGKCKSGKKWKLQVHRDSYGFVSIAANRLITCKGTASYFTNEW